MADSYLPYQNPAVTDAKMDTELITVGANSVHRERIQIAGTGATDIAPVGADGLYVDVRASVLPTGAATSAKQDTIIGHLDGVETLLTAIDGRVDGIEGLLTTIDGRVDGIEGLLTTIDTDTGNMVTALQLLDDPVLTIGTTPLMRVAIFDDNDTQVTSFGGGSGGTQYTEDAAAAANPIGTALNLIRADALAGVTSADGDNLAARGTDKGELYVKHVDSIPVTGTFWQATQPISAAALPLPTGAATAANQTTLIGHVDGIEALLTTVAGAVSGTEMQVDVLTSALPTGAATSAKQDTIIGHLDGVEGLLTTIDADTGNISTKIDTLAGAVAGTEMQVDIVGALPAGTNAIGKLAANSGVDIGDVDILSVNGFTAHDAVIAGNPLIVGGYASAAAPTSVSADGDAVRAWYLRNGAQATVVTAAGALIGGDATNGLDVDVTRVTGTVTTGGPSAIDAAISGNPILNGGRASAAAPTAMSADNDVQAFWLDLRGRQIVAFQAPTGTLSNVASSATSVTLLAANTSRKGATIYNDSTQILYVKFGATASSSSYTIQMAASSYYEVPYGYTGIIDGIWASANGNARVTEIT